MKIDLTAVLNKRCDCLPVDYTFDADKLDGAVILPYGMILSSPVFVKGKVTDSNNCMFLDVNVSADYKTSCDRCLDEICGSVSFDFKRMVAVASSAETDGDETVFVSDSAIDVDLDILEELSLELPIYHICKDDCKGLCQKCGKNLNLGPCDCIEQKEIDPRLKKLQKLLENFD